MTGKELILYILENNLQDELIYDNSRVGEELLGFITLTAAAAKFNVGIATMQAWYELGYIKGFKIGGILFISANTKHPILKGETEECLERSE